MESYINMFFKTELTFLPRLLDRYLGKYYNNTLCNASAWMFLTWYILHMLFDNLLHSLLKKMKFKEYIRVRLVRSLWYLGFHSTAFVYCTATLSRNDLPIFEFKEPFDNANTSFGHLILGFILVSTFYLHSSIWERLKYSHGLMALTYLFLFIFLCFGYFLRFIEGIFRLTIIICITQTILEASRCATALIRADTMGGKLITGLFFTICLSTFIFNYLLVIPILFAYPIIRDYSPSVSIWIVFLMMWLFNEIYGSVLVKGIFHCMNHNKNGEKCENGVIECSLFPPRDDTIYSFLIFQNDMKKREEKYMSLRKPNSRNMLVQTLKCMVAIKRKLKEKRKNTDNRNENDLEESNSKEEDMTCSRRVEINDSGETANASRDDLLITENSETEKNCKHKIE